MGEKVASFKQCLVDANRHGFSNACGMLPSAMHFIFSLQIIGFAFAFGFGVASTLFGFQFLTSATPRGAAEKP